MSKNMFSQTRTAADAISEVFALLKNHNRPKTNKNTRLYFFKLEEKLSFNFDHNIFRKEIISFQPYFNDQNFLWALLYFIDQKYSQTYDIVAGVDGDFTFFENPLNKVGKDKCFVYPKLRDTVIDTIKKEMIKENTNNHFTKRKYEDKINERLQHYIIIPHDELSKKYKYTITKYIDPFLERKINDNKSITIKYIPFLNEKYEDYYSVHYDHDNYLFKVMGVKTTESGKSIYSRFFESLEFALINGEQPQFILFPEMYLTKEIVRDLGSKVKKYKIPYSCLIIAGTKWENNTNRAFVYDHFGNQVITQDKYNAFSYKPDGKEEHYEEDLSHEDHVTINFIDLKGVGRIAIAVCKDFFDNEYRKVLGRMNVDMVFTPSFSPSEDVVRDATSFSDDYRVVSTYVNCCDPRFIHLSNNEIGSITYPYTKKYRNTAQTQFIKKETCQKCVRYCNGVTYKLNIKKLA